MAIKSSDQLTVVDLTDGVSVILTNESHTFPGGVSAALASSTTTTVIAMRGTEQIPASVSNASIVSPTGVTTSVDTDPTQPTITINVSTAVTAGGTVDIPVSLDNGNLTIHKLFTFQIAFKGTGGDSAQWYSGTGITGTSTTATIFSGSGITAAKVGDMYLNTDTMNTYRCTVAGAASVAKWVYVGNIKGDQGATGAGAVWYTGTAITGTSTTGTIFSGSGITDAKVGDMYLNTSTYNTYRCTVAGAASVAKWVYVNNIKGVQGDTGPAGKGVQSTTRYCILQSTPPVKPAVKPPGGNWVTTEPSYTTGSTNSLYFTDLTVFSDNTFTYSDVSLSSSYEAAKAAYNKAASAETTASNAMTAANGKNKVFHQSTAPASSVGLQTGDTWFDTDDGYRMYTWGGSSWAAEQFGVNAIADLSITNAKIANGTIESAKISTLDAGKITSGTIATARLDVNAIFAQNVTATGTITGATLSGGSITGSTITTTSGSIGGWSIGQYMLYTNTSANRIFLQQADGSSRVNVFAVQSLTNTSYYPFRIAYDGTLVSRNQDQYVKLDSGNLYFGDYRMSGAIPRIYGNYDNETGKELNLLCGSSRIEMMENQIDINSDATNGCTFYCPAHFLDSVLCYEDVSCDGDLICEGQAEAGSVRSGRFTDSASNIIFQRYKNGSNPEYPIYWNNAGILRIATKTTNKTPASDNGTSFIIANGLYAAGSVDSTPSVTSAHVYLAGGCDATSRWIGSPAVYGRTYNAAANVYVTSNGYLGRATSSSIKYKHDVEYLTNEGFSAINKGEPLPSKKGCDTSLESVLDIPVVTFKYNEGYVTGEADFDYDKPIAGFIAEDVARVCPECATYVEDENGDRVPEAWDAKQLLVRMLYVLQKQQDEIKQLKERMAP